MATSRTTVQNEWWWYTGDNRSPTSQRFTLLPHLGGLTQRCHVYIFNYNKASSVYLTEGIRGMGDRDVRGIT